MRRLESITGYSLVAARDPCDRRPALGAKLFGRLEIDDQLPVGFLKERHLENPERAGSRNLLVFWLSTVTHLRLQVLALILRKAVQSQGGRTAYVGPSWCCPSQSDTVIICRPALHRAHNNIVAITIAPIRAKTGWLRAGYPRRFKEARKLPRGHCYEGTRRANSARSTSFQLIAYARTIASLAG